MHIVPVPPENSNCKMNKAKEIRCKQLYPAYFRTGVMTCIWISPLLLNTVQLCSFNILRAFFFLVTKYFFFS